MNSKSKGRSMEYLTIINICFFFVEFTWKLKLKFIEFESESAYPGRKLR